MKLNKVKNMWRTLSVIALLGSTLCTSCISEDINRNPLLPTKEDEKMDGVIYGAYLPNLEKSVIPIGTASESTATGKSLSDRSKSGPVTPGGIHVSPRQQIQRQQEFHQLFHVRKLGELCVFFYGDGCIFAMDADKTHLAG